jgi:hypothetical protein
MPNVTINDVVTKSIPDKTDFVPIWDTAAGQQKKAPANSLINAGSISHPGFKSGLWYPPHYYGDTFASLSFAANSFQLCPFFCPRENYFTDIAINLITAVSGGLARLGVFELNTDISPGKVLAQGEVSLAAAGLKSFSISLSSPLLGWYALCLNLNAASSLSANSSQYMKGFIHGVGTPPATNVYASRSASLSYGTGAFTDNPTLSFSNLTSNPVGIWLKSI